MLSDDISSLKLLGATCMLVHSKTIVTDSYKNARSHTELGNGCFQGG